MILTERIIELVHNPAAALWACNCNSHLEPEMVRLLGAKVEADKEHLVLFLPLKYGAEMVQNFAFTDKLSFLLAIVISYESYQLKGTYLSHRPSTDRDIEFQKDYLKGLSATIQEYQGLPGDRAYDAYYHQPSIAVRMHVQEVYEQTPKIGTGEKVL